MTYVAAANRFFALMALLAVVYAIAGLVMLLLSRVPEAVSRSALPFAAAVAVTATAGSLFYSEYAMFPPCTLCWYQRIAIYPQVVVLSVAAWRRDAHVWMTSLPLAFAGAIVSVWHIVLERNPGLSGPCEQSNPCALLWVEEFGFVTIPTMALAAAAAISVAVLIARRPVR